ncbi:36830_t:CDS:2, partial [Gigaspora margarita]
EERNLTCGKYKDGVVRLIPQDELKETRSLIKDECSQIKQILQDIDEEENE